MPATHPEARTAQALFRAGNIASAQAHAARALKDDDADPLAWRVLFACELHERRWKEADALVRRWLARTPDAFEAHRALAELAVARTPRRAQKQLREFLKRFPDETAIVAELEAARLVELQDGRKALKVIAKARARGENSERLDDLERAARYEHDAPGFVMAHSGKALKAKPDDPDALLTHALACFFSFRLFKARKLLRAARRVDPEQSRYYNYYIALTWIALLPNFLAAHLAFIVLLFFTRLPTWIGMFMFVPMLFSVMLIAVVVDEIGLALGVPHGGVVTGVSVVVWWIMLVVGTRLGGRSKRAVALSKDY